MKHGFQVLAAALLALAPACGDAAAADLSVESTDYAKLPEEQQKKLVEELQGKGLLAADDAVVYTGPEVSERRAPPAVLLTLAPLACRAILAAKKREEMAQCAAKAQGAAEAPEGAEATEPAEADTVAAREQCVAEVESRHSTIDLVCSAIKLF